MAGLLAFLYRGGALTKAGLAALGETRLARPWPSRAPLPPSPYRDQAPIRPGRTNSKIKHDDHRRFHRPPRPSRVGRAPGYAQAFADDPGRFARFSASLGDLLLDYSKCASMPETMALLVALAEAADVAGAARRDVRRRGDQHHREPRRAAHRAAQPRRTPRSRSTARTSCPDVNDVLDRVRRFADGVRAGAIRGVDGDRFTDVVNIGIGGSDLGPAMATLALAPYPRRAAPAFRLQCRRRPYRRHARGARRRSARCSSSRRRPSPPSRR